MVAIGNRSLSDLERFLLGEAKSAGQAERGEVEVGSRG
jgi:hypothetical protein